MAYDHKTLQDTVGLPALGGGGVRDGAAADKKSLKGVLERLERSVTLRSVANDAATSTTASSPTTTVMSQTCAGRPGRGRSSASLVAISHGTLKNIASQRGLDLTDLSPTSAYPTPLTRLPLFPPVTRETAIEMFKRGWTRVESPWDGGGVFRAGPALNVYDEDTLLGLMVLRAWRLEGPGNRLPVSVPRLEIQKNNLHDPAVKVDTLYFRISQLESAIRGDTPKGGWDAHKLERRRQSLDDLSGLQLRFDKPHGSSEYAREILSLFRTTGFSKEKNACYYVQFDPLLSRWLETYHTYIDLPLRRKLTDLGCAMHRFLASQRSNHVYRVDLTALYAAIGAKGAVGKLNQQARIQLALMQSNGFIKSFAIVGTGRSQPFVLQVHFSKLAA